jgi:hypothetical protein
MHEHKWCYKNDADWLGCFRCEFNGADRDYYNDLPGKIPPEAGPPPVPPLPNLHPPLTLASASTGAAAVAVTSAVSRPVISETALREHQHMVVQRTQSDRAAGGSCRGDLCDDIWLSVSIYQYFLV